MSTDVFLPRPPQFNRLCKLPPSAEQEPVSGAVLWLSGLPAGGAAPPARLGPSAGLLPTQAGRPVQRHAAEEAVAELRPGRGRRHGHHEQTREEWGEEAITSKHIIVAGRGRIEVDGGDEVPFAISVTVAWDNLDRLISVLT